MERLFCTFSGTLHNHWNPISYLSFEYTQRRKSNQAKQFQLTRNKDMISSKNPRIGEHIEIQYEVYRVDMPPILQWYKGVITTLVLNNSSSIQVTVRFEGSESFPECDESFVLDDKGCYAVMGNRTHLGWRTQYTHTKARGTP